MRLVLLQQHRCCNQPTWHPLHRLQGRLLWCLGALQARQRLLQEVILQILFQYLVRTMSLSKKLERLQLG